MELYIEMIKKFSKVKVWNMNIDQAIEEAEKIYKNTLFTYLDELEKEHYNKEAILKKLRNEFA